MKEEKTFAMKRTVTLLILCLLAGFSAGDAFGQAQITTRKEKLKDLTTRITKVVVPGNDMLAEALKESVSAGWILSPYEFCTQAEFESLKKNPTFYFLMVVKGKNRNEDDPGIQMLTLVKGGPEAAEGIDKMLEVTSFPLAAADIPSGREFIVMPAIVDILQDLASSLTQTELKAYGGLSKYNRNKGKLRTKTIHLDRDDISTSVSSQRIEALDEDILVEDEDAVNEAFQEAAFNGVVSFVVAPEEPVTGSTCYKMLIGADDHMLYYFKKHKITSRKAKGFLASDLKAIGKVR